MRGVLAMLSAGVLACGDNISPGDDSQVGGFQPAAHAPLPQVSGHSNMVLSSVQLSTLTFADDAERDQLEVFDQLVVQSAWYLDVGQEYGIQAGTQRARAVLGAAPASLTPTQATDIVQQAIQQHVVFVPKSLDDQALYLLHVPARVAHPAIADHGFHTTMLVNGFPVVVAVAIDDIEPASTVTAARVLINAVTDPFNPPSDGYYIDPPKTDPWSLVRGEVADLCDREPAMPLDEMHPDVRVPRVYSNRAASLGPPCKPAQTGEIWIDVSADPSRIVKVHPGNDAMFSLTGWSTEETPDWSLDVQATESSSLTLLEMLPELGGTTIHNGGSVTLILHAPANADIGATGGVYVLSGPNAHPWPVSFVIQ